MLIQLVALLHNLVHIDLVLALNDWLAADGASVIVIRPAEKTFDMKDVVYVARQRHHLIAIFEVEQADRALA